jgi:uncharacterized protein with HEPN domain
MSRDETMYLQDILESCCKIKSFTAGLTKTKLLRDDKTYDAVVRNLEIIGEAAKHITTPTKTAIPEVNWRKIAGLRDIIAHEYFGIDNNILWDIIQNRIPELSDALKNFFENADK